MKYYQGRIPTVSLLWMYAWATSEEDAYDKFATKLERANPNIQWRVRAIWDIELVDPQPADYMKPGR